MSCTGAVPEEIRAALGAEPTCEQWRAISFPSEPCGLIAGAGSGKTAVMAARIVWLVLEKHARAADILGLTFTNKAAAHLGERVRRALAPLELEDGDEPTVLTYHAFAARLIQEHGLRAGYEPAASLLSDAQAWQMRAELFTAHSFENLEVRTLYHVDSVRQLAEDCANHLCDPAEVIAHDREFLRRIERAERRIAARPRFAALERIDLAGVVARYQQEKRARHVLDYGDQIRVARMLADLPEVAAEFRARYRFALLDEYQDTNVAQARLLQSLMPAGFPVMAVGDPDQNIYAWRGASLHNLLAFGDQFPRADGSSAVVLPLQTNFRSGRRILVCANRLIEKIPDARRPHEKVLRPHPPLGEGAVEVLCVTDQITEAARTAGILATEHEAGTPWREMAILCRKRRLIGPLVGALRDREIPVEVIGIGGLLRTPEVTDLVSLMRILENPMANVAIARLLRGPRWRIGYRDLALVARHAAAKNRRLREDLPADEADRPGDAAFSLAEALDDLEAIEGVSAEARRRLERFGAELAGLRAQTHLPLPDLAAGALRMLGLERELRASPSRAAPAALRNLANFLDRVAEFSPIDGEPTLGALIAWLDATEESGEDIDAAQPTEDESVKLMTIHQAKGLEFDVVVLPGLVGGRRSSIFPDTTRQPNPLRQAKHLPFDLRGDRAVLPTFTGNLSAFTEELRARALEEERRLVYVAVTRARRRLVATAAHWYHASGRQESLSEPLGPSEFWSEIRNLEDTTVLEEAPCPEENPIVEIRSERAAGWPPTARRDPDPLFPDGYAAAVLASRDESRGVPGAEPRPREPRPREARPREPQPGLLPAAALERLDVAPQPPRTVGATSLVTYARCPKRFYWSDVRPLPRAPNPAARRGTAIHTWIESRYTRVPTLLDPEDLDPPREPREEEGTLKRAFEATRFAKRDAKMVEQPFVVVLPDGFAVRGKIDAIFEDGDRWEIVDWKTSRPPGDEGTEALQLDIYALAAQDVWGKAPEQLSLAFVYLGGGEAVERTIPARPGAEIRAELVDRLQGITAGRFDPVPGAWCGHCDFLRFCEAGRAFLGDPGPPGGG